MTAYSSVHLHTDADNKRTSARYGDPAGGAGTDEWYLHGRLVDGADVAKGAKADAAVTDPTAAGSVIALLKGILTNVRVAATGLLKLEDAAAASGDAGVMALAVRRDTAVTDASAAGDYHPLHVDALGRLRTIATRDTTAGNPTVAATTALAASLVVKAAAGTIHGIAGYTTTAQFIQLHDAASLPADTAVPELVVPVAANTFFNIPLPGHVCATGIVVCNSTTGPTKTIGGADTWITAYYD